MEFRYPNLLFFAEISTKTIKSCSAINYLSNDINILAGDDSIPVKFEPIKAPTLNKEGFLFYVSHAARCAVSDSRP